MAKARMEGMDWRRLSRRSGVSIIALTQIGSDLTASGDGGVGRGEALPQACRTSHEAAHRACLGSQERCAGRLAEGQFAVLFGGRQSCSFVGTPELSSSPRGE